MRVPQMAALFAAVLTTAFATSAAAQQQCQFVKLGEMAVDMSRGPPVVEIEANGVKRKMILRTGADFSGLRRSDIIAMGGVRRGEANLVTLSPKGESRGIEYASLKDVTVGGAFVMPKFDLLVRDDGDLANEIAGVIGGDLLGATDVEFDLANSKVTFYTPRNCANANLGHWGGEISETKLLTSVASARAISLDIITFRPQIEINGKTVTAQMDSGLTFSIVDSTFAATVGIRPDQPGVRMVESRTAGGKPQWVSRLNEFVIGGEKITRPAVLFTDLTSGIGFVDTGSRLRTRLDGLPVMILGLDFMRSHRILVANSQGKMYFSYNGGQVFRVPPPQDASPAAGGN